MTIQDFVIDFAFASILVLIGQFLRSNLKIFQKFFIPASVLAGFLGLIFGPNGLGWIPFSEAMGGYAGLLIILVFVVVGVNGFEFKRGSGDDSQLKRILGYQIFKIIVWALQIFVPLVFTIVVLKKIWPGLNDGFGMLLHSGFYGGHGTAAAVGSTFKDLGFEDAQDIAITFATFGILTGIFGGIILINIAARKGQTAYMKDFKFIDGDMKTGLISFQNRRPFGQQTISSVSLDTLTYHGAFIIALTGMTIVLNRWLAEHVLAGIPDFTLGFILALIFFLLLRNTPVYDYIDKDVNTRISGSATDYLVIFGIASVKLDVVMSYAGPIILSLIVGWLLVFIIIWPLGKAYSKNDWFERSIFVYGYLTGVFAIGFVLYRIVDPDNISETIEDTAMTPATNIAEIVVWSLFPALLISGQWLIAAAIPFVILIGSVIATKVTGTWVFNVPDSERNVLKNQMK